MKFIPTKRSREAERWLKQEIRDQKLRYRKIVAEQLRHLGYECDFAHDGQEAIDLLLAPDQPYRLVLMDCRMPRLTGLEATRILKQRWPDTKVVALTLYPEFELDARLAGADAVLMKGCAAAQLVSAIRTVAGG